MRGIGVNERDELVFANSKGIPNWFPTNRIDRHISREIPGLTELRGFCNPHRLPPESAVESLTR